MLCILEWNRIDAKARRSKGDGSVANESSINRHIEVPDTYNTYV